MGSQNPPNTAKQSGGNKPVQAVNKAANNNDQAAPHDCKNQTNCKKKKKKTFIVVAGDGGGMKGINLLTLLHEISRQTGTKTSDFSFLHVGCSTSTLASGGLIVPSKDDRKKPHYDEKDIRKFYFQDGPIIFPHKKKDLSDYHRKMMKKRGLMHGDNQFLRFIFNGSFYNDKNLRAVLEDRFGDVKAKDCIQPFVFPTTDFKRGQPVWFTNSPEIADRFEDAYYVPDMKMADIIEACVRPNFFFRYKEMSFTHKAKNHETGRWEDQQLEIIPTDGTYFAGAPESYAYGFAKCLLAAKGYKEDEYRIVMLSLGTGKKLTNNTADELNGMKGFWSKRFKSLAQLSGFATTADLALTLQFRARRAELKETMNRNGDLYFRFEAEIDPNNPQHPDGNISNASLDNMRKLVRFAKQVVIPENRAEFDTFVELVKRYKAGQDIEDIAEKRLNDYYKPLASKKANQPQKGNHKKGFWSQLFGSNANDSDKKSAPPKKDKKRKNKPPKPRCA